MGLIYDAEVVKLLVEIFSSFSAEIPHYYIRVSHMKLFEAILMVCGVDLASIPEVHDIMMQFGKVKRICKKC